MSHRELGVWALAGLVLVSLRWAFLFPVAVPESMLSAIAEAEQPTQGSIVANQFCEKAHQSHIADIESLTCTDTESGQVETRGHCSPAGKCKIEEYKDQTGVWQPISGKAGSPTPQSAQGPTGSQDGLGGQRAVGPNASANNPYLMKYNSLRSLPQGQRGIE